MNRSAAAVDFESPNTNMYGCSPCPECGGEFRWCRASDKMVICDDCGHEEPGVIRTKERTCCRIGSIHGNEDTEFDPGCPTCGDPAFACHHDED